MVANPWYYTCILTVHGTLGETIDISALNIPNVLSRSISLAFDTMPWGTIKYSATG